MSSDRHAWATIIIDYPDGKHTAIHGRMSAVEVENDVHRDTFMDYHNVSVGPGVTYRLRFPQGATGTTMLKEDA